MEVFCLNVISDSIIHWFFSDEASITKPTFFQEIHPPPIYIYNYMSHFCDIL